MHTIPSISRLYEEDYHLYQSFIRDCVEYSISSNLKHTNPPKSYSAHDFYNWVDTDNIYICNRESRNIGIILFETKETAQGRVHSVSFYIHPKVCKLASISLARASAVVAFCETVSLKDNKFLTTTFHSLVFTVFSQAFPVKAVKHGSFYLISSEFDSEVVKEYFLKTFEHEDLKSYFELFNLNI